MTTEAVINIVPPEIHEDKLEDYLATDQLFVAQLNKYLSLPTFKEKYRFNATDCAFELLSDVQETLMRDIEKAAAKVKKQDETFAPVRQITISPQTQFQNLIHPAKNDQRELATTYDVQCLNTEQGLHWTRETKMPRFLTSSLYSQYRLLKILNQVSIGKPKVVKLVDTEPIQTPRSIVSAQKKRAQIREKIDKEQKEKEEKLKLEEEMRVLKQQEAFAKLKKAADPTLPGQDELEVLKVSVGETPADDLREWYKHLKKAQEKQGKRSGKPRSRPTSASSGIVRPDSKLIEKQGKEVKDEVTGVPTLALADETSPMKKESELAATESREVSEPVVNRPRSGEVCHVDESETKVGFLHENRTIQENEEDTQEEGGTSDADSSVNFDSQKEDNDLLGEADKSNIKDTKPEKERKHKSKKSGKNELFFRGIEDLDSFLEFLSKTPGNQMYNFWIELDKCNFADSKQDLKNCLVEIKDKYCSITSPDVLPNQFRSANNLRHITSFNKDQVKTLQNKTVEPLVKYWVPKYLNEKKQKYSKILNSNKTYKEHRNVTKSRDVFSYPEPKTPVALPLRPKTCLPKIDISIDHSDFLGKLEIPEKKSTRAKSAVVSKPEAIETRMSSSVSKRTKSAQLTKRDVESGIGTSSFVDDLEIYDDNDEGVDDLSDSELESGFEPDSGRGQSMSLSRPTTGKKSTRFEGTINESDEEADDFDVDSLSSYGSSIRDLKKFIGSSKMETLLQTLKHEFNTSGGVFKHFLLKSGNQAWINCLDFWNDLQNYHALFYKDTLDADDVLRKAKAIYALFIVLTAPKSINSTPDILKKVSVQLSSPNEETFDAAEEYSISKLREPWIKMLETEEFEYKKVELYYVKRSLEIDPEYLKFLNKQGVVKVHAEVEEEEPEVDEEKEREEYYKKLEFEVPEEFRSWLFDDLLKNRIEFEYFRRFIADNYGTTDLSCWVDIEGFKRMAHDDEVIRDTKATEIKSKYLNKKYFFGPNSPATTKEQELVLALAGGWGKQIVPERPPNIMITEVGRYTRERLERKWLAMFLATPGFAGRQASRHKSGDSAEDIVMQKKRKQLQLSKIMESKWVSSSKEVIQFRRALLNPVTSDQFKKYVRIVTKENFLENDIIFWQEVQKFKDLFQPHAEDSLVQFKVQMIIACFLESIIYPAVQVDIPPEQVQDILDKRKKPTAYMFREAQLTVFRVLYPHWTEFCKFRHKMKSTNKIESTLDRKSGRLKTRQRKLAQKTMDAMGGTGSGHDETDGLGVNAANVMDDIIMSQGDNVTTWKYSSYLDALKKQHQSLLDEVSSRASDLSDSSSIIGPMYPTNQSSAK